MSCATFRTGTSLEFEVSGHFQGDAYGPRGLSFAFRDYSLEQLLQQMKDSEHVEVVTHLTAAELLLPFHYFLSSTGIANETDGRLDLILDVANGRIPAGGDSSLTLPIVVMDQSEDSFARFEIAKDQVLIRIFLSSDVLRGHIDWLENQTSVVRLDSRANGSNRAGGGSKASFVVSLTNARVSELIRWVVGHSLSGKFPQFAPVLEQLSDIELSSNPFHGRGVGLKVGFGRGWKHYVPVSSAGRELLISTLTSFKLGTSSSPMSWPGDNAQSVPTLFDRLLKKVGL